MKYAGFISSLIFLAIFSGCQKAERDIVLISVSPPPKTATSTFEVKQTETLLAPIFSPEPSSTDEAPIVNICTPLAGYSSADLEEAIVNPYSPPPPGVDRPHHGVDLGVVDGETGLAVTGEGIHAILTGEIKMVIADRFPYGNAVLIETSLGNLNDPVNILEPLPTLWVEVTPDPALTCPSFEELAFTWDRLSIYLLYAHLDEPPSTLTGTEVQCGEEIGKIGMSGNALNPHLHIEARIGPAGADFESMAHYDSSATVLEMGAYCLWRVSGIFQHFDPMILLRNLPAYP